MIMSTDSRQLQSVYLPSPNQVMKWQFSSPIKYIPNPIAEVEKVKSVSGNLRIGPKTFCKTKESDMKKVAFCLQLLLIKVHKITYFLTIKVQQLKFSLHFWNTIKKGMKNMTIC